MQPSFSAFEPQLLTPQLLLTQNGARHTFTLSKIFHVPHKRVCLFYVMFKNECQFSYNFKSAYLAAIDYLFFVFFPWHVDENVPYTSCSLCCSCRANELSSLSISSCTSFQCLFSGTCSMALLTC